MLEAGLEYVVKSHAQIEWAVKGEVLLSATKTFVERHGVVARVLVEPQPFKTVSLCIFNPEVKTVTIKKGARFRVRVIQVQLIPRARLAAAFRTRKGLFEWNVMSFELCNASPTFQQLMDCVQAGMQWKTCFVYLDDINVLGGMCQRCCNDSA